MIAAQRYQRHHLTIMGASGVGKGALMTRLYLDTFTGVSSRLYYHPAILTSVKEAVRMTI